MSYSKQDLSDYRKARAKEALEEAKLLASAHHWNAAANRLYYACFYIVSAYFILDETTTSTHTGIKTVFNKALVSQNKVSKVDGQLYNKLFSLRQDADYRDFNDVNASKVKPLIHQVEMFIDTISLLIQNHEPDEQKQ